MTKTRKLLIVEVEPRKEDTLFTSTPKQFGLSAVSAHLAKLSGSEFADYGRNLDTVAKARAWLTDERNWFKSNMFIIRWDGLTPTVSEHHGKRLQNEPWDDGLAEVVVVRQQGIRAGHQDTEEQDVIE